MFALYLVFTSCTCLEHICNPSVRLNCFPQGLCVCVLATCVCERERVRSQRGRTKETTMVLLSKALIQDNNGALIQGQLCTGMCLAAHLPVYQQVFVRISKLMNNTDLHITHAKKLFTIHGRKNPTCPKNPLPPGLCAAPGFVRRTRFFWL